MYATTAAAIVLDQHRATDLNREVELLRRHAERPESVITRPTAFAVVAGWVLKIARTPSPARTAAAH